MMKDQFANYVVQKVSRHSSSRLSSPRARTDEFADSVMLLIRLLSARD